MLSGLDGGVAVVTEGLLNYLDRRQVETLWRRLAACADLYLADLVLLDAHPAARFFGAALSAFVGGAVHLHWSADADVAAALTGAGWTRATLHVAGERPAVRVLEAS